MRIEELIKFPVRFVEGSDGIILDARNNYICDIRMWGYLESTYGKHAQELQDQTARFVVKAINEQFNREEII